MARRAFDAMISSSTNSFLTPPTQPLDPKINEATSTPPLYSTSPYSSTATPAITSTGNGIPNTSASVKKSKKHASNRFRSNAGLIDAPSIPQHRYQRDVDSTSGTNSYVASSGITSVTGSPRSPRLPESASDKEGWDGSDPDPFGPNRPAIPTGFASRRTSPQASTPAPSIIDTAGTSTTTKSQQPLPPRPTSSRLGSKIHRLLHSRSSRTLKETGQNHPASTPRTISEQQISRDATPSSSNLGGRRRVKSFSSQGSALPSSASFPAESVPLPMLAPLPPPPAPHLVRPGSATSAPQEECVQLDLTEPNMKDADNLASLDEFVIGIRSRGDSGPHSPSVMSSLSNTTVTGARSISSISGVASSPEPLTPTSMSSRTFGLVQPRSSMTKSRPRSRSNSATDVDPAPRSVRSATPLSSSVGPGANVPSSASLRAMRPKRSMPELDGVWKGFLEEIEEDAVVLLPSANGTTGSENRSISPIKIVRSATSNRRPRRATTSGTTTGILSSSPLPPTPQLPPLPSSPPSGFRRPHAPPRLSLSSAALSQAQDTLPTPAVKSPTPSSASVFPKTPPSVPNPQPQSLSPVTPPFTPSIENTDFSQSARHNRPVSTATASSTFTIKAKQPPIPDSAFKLAHGNSVLATPITPIPAHTFRSSRDGTSIPTAHPMVRQESVDSHRSIVDKEQGNTHAGAPFVEDSLSAHRTPSHQGDFPGSAVFNDKGSIVSGTSLEERLSPIKGVSHLDFETRSTSRPGSGSASTRSTHSRAASSLSLLSLTSSVNSASHLIPQSLYAPSHSFESRSQASFGSDAQQLSISVREHNRRVYSRPASHKNTTSTDSSNYTSNESASLLSWRSDPEEIQDGFSDHQIAVVRGARSRASSRATSLLGNEMDSTVSTAKAHTLYHLPSPPAASPSMSPTRLAMPNNNALELSPRSRYRRSKHTRQSSASSISSISSSLVSSSANSTRSRALLPIGTSKAATTPPLTPPNTATPSPTDGNQVTPLPRRNKPHSASTPPALVTTLHGASSRQQDAELLRAVRALEAEAEIAVLATTGGTGRVRVKHHQSLTPAAARSLARTTHSSRGDTSNRPEMHTRSRSHDILASMPVIQSLPSRDRSASHPHIGDELGYAI